MATYLDAILDAHRCAARARAASPGAPAGADGGLRRPFRAAIATSPGLALIAEVKRRSPSKGDLAPDLDPTATAVTYERAGATCVSVLTDEAHFGGSLDDLIAARAACALPVLRKDFTVCEADVRDAAAAGADCVLLIVAALDDTELQGFRALAVELGLDALVEVHDEAEVERALAAGADLIGVNQRDLATFEVDTARAVRVASAIPRDVVRVAESGIRGHDDAQRLRDAGYDAILVGEALVTAPDMAARVRELQCS